jgi:hypothetical protein
MKCRNLTPAISSSATSSAIPSSLATVSAVSPSTGPEYRHSPAAALYQNQNNAGAAKVDRQSSAEPTSYGIRPHRTAPGLRSVTRPQVYKSLPNLQQEQLASPDHHREDSLIDLSPAADSAAGQRLYANTADGDGTAGSNLAVSTSSLLDLPMEEQEIAWTSQSYANDFSSGGGGTSLASSTFIAASEYSHDSSFNSLPDGATYHEPPGEEDEEEPDPFDTSSVVVNSSAGSAEANIASASRSVCDTSSDLNQSGAPPPASTHQPLSDSDNSFENRRSIIAQLLASSRPTSNPFVAQSETSMIGDGSSTPVGGAALLEPAESRQRNVSTVSELDVFGGLLPLTSPFSPPAFNPYDVVLGPNETIAGENGLSCVPSFLG